MKTSVTQFDRFAFDGPISVSMVILLGLALAVLFIWSLTRERQVIGKSNFWIFSLLRLTALGVAFWMLLGPSNVKHEEIETRKSIALLTDTSQSMLTIDPDDDVEDLRWKIDASSSQLSPIVLADRALSAALLAEDRIRQANEALAKQQSEQTAFDLAGAANDAVQRIRANISELDVWTNQNESNNDALRMLQKRCEEVSEVLNGPDFRRLRQLADQLNLGSEQLQSGWREGLLDLQYQLTSMRRRIDSLADLATRIPGQQSSFAAPSTLTENSKESRLTKVKQFVDHMQSSLFDELNETANIRFGTFDQRVIWEIDRGKTSGESSGNAEAAEPQKTADDSIADGQASTDLTVLLEAIRKAQQDENFSAVFVLTDAAHNATESRDPRVVAAELAGTSCYFVPIGNTDHVRDLDLKSISVPGVVMKDDDVVIEATLQAYMCQGEVVRVELLQDGQVIQDREMVIESDSELLRARFNANLDTEGQQHFQVRIPAIKGELSDTNNFNQFEVNVTRNHIDVLVADEMPRWEYRYLTQLFRRDPKVACDELLFRPRVIATGRRKESKALPTTADEWAQYDVVLLGDLSTERLSVEAQEGLEIYLRERGGTVLLIAGDEYMPGAYMNQPLQELLPVSKADRANPVRAADGFDFRVTEAGWDHDALMIADTEESTRIAWNFISQNAPLYSLSEFRVPRPSARVLLAAASRADVDAEATLNQNALLCWQPIGRGRVMYLGSPETYRLRFLRGDRLHYRFWGQLLRWAIASDLAAGTQRVAIRSDRPNYIKGEKIEVSVLMQNADLDPVTGAQIEVVAKTEDSAVTTIPLTADPTQPGRYIGEMSGVSAGIYQLEPIGEDVDRLLQGDENSEQQLPIASLTVQEPMNREVLDTRSDRALAKQIAEATGGHVVPPTALAEVIKLMDLKPIVTKKTEVTPLWVQWKFLWIVFGCLFTEWVIRKRLGLS